MLADVDLKEQKFIAGCIAQGKLLTRRQTQILRACLKDEIVESGGRAAVGNLFISSRTIIALLNCCAIREDAFGYYQITATGREILKGRP